MLTLDGKVPCTVTISPLTFTINLKPQEEENKFAVRKTWITVQFCREKKTNLEMFGFVGVFLNEIAVWSAK